MLNKIFYKNKRIKADFVHTIPNYFHEVITLWLNVGNPIRELDRLNIVQRGYFFCYCYI